MPVKIKYKNKNAEIEPSQKLYDVDIAIFEILLGNQCNRKLVTTASPDSRVDRGDHDQVHSARISFFRFLTTFGAVGVVVFMISPRP